MQIEDILGYLSPTAQAFVTQALNTGQQDVIDTILQVIQSAPDPQTGIAMVEQAIQEFLGQGGVPGVQGQPAAPGGPVDPSQVPGPPMDPSAPPGAVQGPPGAPPMPPG